ncbi:putative methionine--tRNA ligase [Helianthus anomalus]
MAMGICRQGSLSGGELGREIPSAVKGTKDEEVEFFTAKFAGSQADRAIKAEAEANKIAEQMKNSKGAS